MAKMDTAGAESKIWRLTDPDADSESSDPDPDSESIFLTLPVRACAYCVCVGMYVSCLWHWDQLKNLVAIF